MERSAPPIIKPNISFQIQLPNEWDPNLAERNFGVTAVVEATKCNPGWIENCKNMDHVIVPSEFSKKVLVNSGAESENISVIPESFISECLNDNDFSMSEIKTDFNFLLLGQLTGSQEDDRKNTYNTIATFCNTFKDNKEVGLIIKTNSGRNCAIDRRITRRNLSNLINQVRDGQYPKVYLIHGALSESEISGLYKNKKVKALLSGTRGEGFGLPMLEAAACNLPVIATNWSAHCEFLNKGKWLSVSYNLKNIPDSRVDNNIWIQGSSWAEIDFRHLSERIYKFYKKGTSIPETWSSKLGKVIRQKYSQEAISELYDKFLRDHT